MNFALTVATSADNPVEGDLDLADSQVWLIDGSDAIAQHLRNRLKFFLGEWFLDVRQGLPFFQRVFVKNPNLPAIRAIFRRVVRETPGVSGVQDLTLSVSPDRIASISFVALLDSGDDPLVFIDFVIGEF